MNRGILVGTPNFNMPLHEGILNQIVMTSERGEWHYKRVLVGESILVH